MLLSYYYFNRIQAVSRVISWHLHANCAYVRYATHILPTLHFSVILRVLLCLVRFVCLRMTPLEIWTFGKSIGGEFNMANSSELLRLAPIYSGSCTRYTEKVNTQVV